MEKRPSLPSHEMGKAALWVTIAGWASLVAGILVFGVLEYLTFLSNEAATPVNENRAHVMEIVLVGFLVLNPLLCVLGALLALPARKERLGNAAVLVGGANLLFWVVVVGAALLLTPPGQLLGN